MVNPRNRLVRKMRQCRIIKYRNKNALRSKNKSNSLSLNFQEELDFLFPGISKDEKYDIEKNIVESGDEQKYHIVEAIIGEKRFSYDVYTQIMDIKEKGRIPGFRMNHVNPSIIELRFGKSIREQVLSSYPNIIVGDMNSDSDKYFGVNQCFHSVSYGKGWKVWILNNDNLSKADSEIIINNFKETINVDNSESSDNNKSEDDNSSK